MSRVARGNSLSVLFGAALCVLAGATALAQDRAALDGVWLFTGSQVPDNLHLTAAGEAAVAAYEPLTDDGDNYCIPVSFTNIMHTPSPPFEIRQHAEHVEINYEFMDVRRRVPLDPTLTVETAPPTVADHPHMGRSVGHYDGEVLVVDTAGVEAGVLDTLGVPGLPQSAEMRTEERFIAEGDRLDVVVTHHDPINYSRDLVVRYGFHRLDSEILEWGCEPEAAGYDRFLNRDAQGAAE